jgi:hypothetical protein
MLYICDNVKIGEIGTKFKKLLFRTEKMVNEITSPNILNYLSKQIIFYKNSSTSA